MVKKLISGFLKRGGKEEEKGKEAEEEKPSEEVPEELPSLGEESIDEAEGQEELPDELPSLEAKPEVADVRDAPRTTEEAKEPELSSPQPVGGEGFFSNISKMVSNSKTADKLVSQDLLASMKESYGIKEEAAKTGLSSSEAKHVQAALNDVLTQLRAMEGKWRAHKAMLEEYQKLVSEEEMKIKQKEKELKELLKRSKLFVNVPDDKAVMLKGSIPIRNLSELINSLRRMDQSAFRQHVSKGRNDFSELAASVDKGLAEQLKRAGSKKSMLNVLERFVKSLK